MTARTSLLCLCAVFAGLSSAAAQALKIIPVPEGVTGFRTEFLREMSSEEAKLVSLAASMPAAKMTWRPGEGVRSVSEVFPHVAAANYNLLSHRHTAAVNLRGDRL